MPYDPGWPRQYADEAEHLTTVLSLVLEAIEHIGSTAVPGMAAKPVIDILVGVRSYDGFESVIGRLATVGYLYTPEAEDDDPGRKVFRKGPDDMARSRTHHLHVTEVDSHYWRRMLAFRDHLRQHPDDAAAYVELKRRLALRFAHEPRSYTAAKHDFVSAIERTAGVAEQP